MVRSLLLSTALQTSALSLALACAAQAQPAPNARPTGGVVVAGAAAISRTPTATTIDQSSPRAAVNWQSFDIGSQQSVDFVQPSTSAITLNRVTGPNPSQIAGSISANGQVVLVNQSGVTFYKGAQVNTNGLMVSAADISNRNFMAGVMKFDRPAKLDAQIVNAGTITIAQAGLAALVAPQVVNSGVISAKLGHVILAGAKTATLDLYGDGLLSLDVNNAVAATPSGATALVTNTGVIEADGGTVQLTARAADGIIQNLVDAGGKIRTATSGGQAGTIALNGIGGSIVVDGVLAAPGIAPGTTGGSIEVVASGNVTLTSTARINASGKAGGGVVAIGTTLQRAAGGASVTATQIAANTIIQTGATIDANAITSGNGGRIAVLSTNVTEMGGAISATGGADGGNGGMVETSGTDLGVTGSVDLAAPYGTVGEWLLDPAFLDVVAGASGSGSEDANFRGTGTVLAGDGMNGSPDTISNSIINGSTADVVLQALDTLTVSANINLSQLPNQTLTLEAGGMLTVDPGVNVTAIGNVILATGGAGPAAPTPPAAQPTPLINVSGTVTSGTGSISVLSGTGGAINIASGGSLGAATVTLNSGSGGIAIGGVLGQAGAAIDITSAGPVTEASTGAVVAATLASAGGIQGTANLIGSANAIGAIGNVAVTGGNLNVVDNANLTLAGTQSANNLLFQVTQAGGTLTLGQFALANFNPPAALTTPGAGRISLVADNVVVGNAASTITTNGGTVEIAPTSSIATSVLGNSGLVVGAPLLSIIQTNGGTLDIGGFTNTPLGAASPVASAGSVDIGAPFNVSGIAGTLRLDATGAVTQSGGALTAGNLVGTGGNWTLTNAGNAIAALGTITATNFALTDNSALAINGTVAASDSATLNTTGVLTINGLLGSASTQLSASSIAIPGSLDANNGNLTATGSINATGSLIVGTLTGSAGGTVSFAGNSTVAILGNFTTGSFTLRDATDLVLSGTLTATNIALTDALNAIILNNGATLVTGGNTRPGGAIQPALEPANGAAGAYLQAAQVIQTGTATVQGQGGGPATLQIATSSTTRFDPSLGLQAPGTWLILDLGPGSTAGNVFVNALDVSYTIPGSASLTGTIAGIAGGAAAAAGFIQPAINSNYLFNGCVIAAAVCNPLPPQPPTPPVTPPVLPNAPPGSSQTLALAVTSTLGGVYDVLPDVALPLATLPNLVVVALPVPPAPLPQLTDPDVVPPNIATVDY